MTAQEDPRQSFAESAYASSLPLRVDNTRMMTKSSRFKQCEHIVWIGALVMSNDNALRYRREIVASELYVIADVDPIARSCDLVQSIENLLDFDRITAPL